VSIKKRSDIPIIMKGIELEFVDMHLLGFIVYHELEALPFSDHKHGFDI
jgi:hypothetical protein